MSICQISLDAAYIDVSFIIARVKLMSDESNSVEITVNFVSEIQIIIRGFYRVAFPRLNIGVYCYHDSNYTCVYIEKLTKLYYLFEYRQILFSI